MSQPRAGLSPSAPAPPEPLDWCGVESVLLIRLRSIGDTILMTPCLGAIKSWRPDIRITVVSEPLAAPLLKDHPLVDQLVIAGKGTASRIALVRGLRYSRFDAAFNLHGGSTGTILAALSGATTTVGYRGYRYSGLLKMRAPAPDRLLARETIHSVEQQLALISWAGVPWPAEVNLSLPLSADALASVEGRLKAAGIDRAQPGSNGYAVLSPCASAESKRWPAAYFAQVADHLKRRHQLTSVVIAGPGEEAIAGQITGLADNCAVDITGIDLKELVALLARSSVFIGNDSGPMHMAAAFDRPIVAMFGTSNPSVWSPWTQAPHRVLTAPAATRDIGQIGVQDVTAAADEIMPAGSARTS
jgi:heptosyltransferase-3